ncbi:MAG: alpha-amylase [Bacteroidales bacterium]|jgi:glycosidase|nr:alpha-amylase [Bacteroidales bacterium]
MSARKEKLTIYQAVVRIFGNTNMTRKPDGSIEENGCGKMNDFNAHALQSIKKLGCNCVWYTGLLQQATATDYTRYGLPRYNAQVLKGKAGSPYAITDYYSVSCDLADNPAHRMDEFDGLVKRTHEAGLRMLMDFVPNHVGRQYHSVGCPKGVRDLGADDNVGHQFNPQNNFYYCAEPLHLDNVGTSANGAPYVEEPARATGNDVFHAWPSRNDWYETVKLNYGVDYCGGGQCHFDPMPDTWLKMRDILLFWCARGVDGFRCDMCFMVPVEFWHWCIAEVKRQYPDVIFIGEIYDPAIYRSYIGYGGFDYLYDKVGLYDTLRAVVECRESASAITRCWQSVDDIQDRMLNFLENHDEQRVASDFFAGDARKALPAFVVSALMRTNPFMLYFGQELGERGMDAEGFSGRDGRTTIFDYWALASMQDWIGAKHDYRTNRLGQEQCEIRDYYATVLNLSHKKPFAEGSFFDLTYCNYGNARYDIHRQFAFLRHAGKETVLVVANFDAEEKRVAVNIPAEAWDYVGIKADGERSFSELLTGAVWSADLVRNRPFELAVPGYGASIVRL